jgi:hypothetical protein
MKIRIAERELAEALKSGNREWSRAAAILSSIQPADLAESGYKEIGEWIRAVGRRNEMKAASIWRWLRAGQFYHELRRRHRKIPELRRSPVGLVTLEILARLHRVVPPDEFGRIFRQVLDGTLAREQLRKLWDLYRSAEPKPHSVQTRRTYEAGVSDAQILSRIVANVCSIPWLAEGRRPALYEMIAGIDLLADPGIQPDLVLIAGTPTGKASVHFIEVKSTLTRGWHVDQIAAISYSSPYCNYAWMAVSGRPSARIRSELISEGIGLLIAEGGGVAVDISPSKRPGSKADETMHHVWRKRLSGRTTWSGKCSDP